MIMNLISNAAEAMPKGGSITLSTQNTYINSVKNGFAFLKEADYVVLTVADTGIGISKKDQDKIFEPFYTKKELGRSGSGLGMAVVWGTVEDHHGYIDVKSSKGKGTTFTIYFPATRKKLRGDEHMAVSVDEYRGKGEKILVVDDLVTQRDIASEILSELGYAVDTVSSGEDAIEYMKTHTADLLMLDMIMLPGMNGLETYEKILEHHPDQKAIIASGFSETGLVKKAQGLGVGAFIRKPYTLEKIGLAIKAELGKTL
jgi:CheY-like chemotaxis protein